MEIGFDVIGSVLIGVFVGFIANKLPKDNKLGLFTSFSIGMVGALVGSFILNLCRISYSSLTSEVLLGYAVSLLGSSVFLYLAFRVNKQHNHESLD